jgi:hypothetical protein
LENKGAGEFTSHRTGKGFKLKGELRDMAVDGKKLIAARNRDSLAIFEFGKETDNQKSK